MQKTIQVGPFDSGYTWRFVVDGHLVDYGYDEDLRVARAQAQTAAEQYNKTLKENGNEERRV